MREIAKVALAQRTWRHRNFLDSFSLRSDWLERRVREAEILAYGYPV